MSKLLVDALERLKDRCDCDANVHEHSRGGCVGVIATNALQTHRASSLVDDAELRSKLYAHLGSARDVTAVIRIFDEHLGRGQR